jgi:hypothetical protein
MPDSALGDSLVGRMINGPTPEEPPASNPIDYREELLALLVAAELYTMLAEPSSRQDWLRAVARAEQALAGERLP